MVPITQPAREGEGDIFIHLICLRYIGDILRRQSRFQLRNTHGTNMTVRETDVDEK